MAGSEKKYNAFISYRHKPLDMAVAVRIHRYLENFKLPLGERKRGKRIDRIFRDKDELPIASDLIDSIYSGLDNSEYLIVICSRNTPESIYIQREVEYFIDRKGAEKIIVLHIQGELEEALPLSLKEIYDEGTRSGSQVLNIIDIRAENEQDTLILLKTEYIRIASILLDIDEETLGKKHYNRLVVMNLVIYGLVLAVLLGVQIKYRDMFSKAKEHEEKLAQKEDELKRIERLSSAGNSSILFWTRDMAINMTNFFSNSPEAKPLMENMLEGNFDLLYAVQDSTDSKDLLKAMAIVGGECADINFRMGQREDGEWYLNSSLGLWYRADIKAKKSLENNELFYRAKAYRMLGGLASDNKDWEKALRYSRKAFDEIDRANAGDDLYLLYQKGLSAIDMGRYYYSSEKYLESEKSYEDARKVFEILKGMNNSYNYSYEMAACFFGNTIDNMMEKGNGGEGFNALIESIKTLENSPNIKGNAVLLQYAGNCLVHEKNYREAESYLMKAVNIYDKYYSDSKEAGELINYAESLRCLGDVKIELGKVEEALGLYNKALATIQGIDLDKDYSAYNSTRFYINMGFVKAYALGGSLNSSKASLIAAEAYANDKWDNLELFYWKSILAINAGHYDEAIGWNEKSIELISKNPSDNYINRSLMAFINSNYVLSLLYKGEKEKALEVIKSASNIGDNRNELLAEAVEALLYYVNGDYDRGNRIITDKGDLVLAENVIVRYGRIEFLSNEKLRTVVEGLLKGYLEIHKDDRTALDALKMIS